jgi:hypothetical protein
MIIKTNRSTTFGAAVFARFWPEVVFVLLHLAACYGTI